MDPDLRYLRWFVVLAEELHFHRAAGKLHVSQPTLSRAVARLERDAGAQLLERGTRGVTLTPAGRVYLEGARTTLAAASDMLDAARAAAQQGRDRLRLGYGAAFQELTTLLREAERELPHVEIVLSNHVYRDITAGLATGATDVAFTMPQLDLADLLFLPLVAVTRVALLPTSHPYADRDALALSDLRTLHHSDTWLVPEGPPTATREYQRFWSGADGLDGAEPDRSEVVRSNEELAQLLDSGRGVALGFDRFGVRYAIPGIAEVPVPGLPLGLVGLAWRSTRVSPALEQLVELARPHRAGDVPPGRVVAGAVLV